jgi:predicted transcriptional regulator
LLYLIGQEPPTVTLKSERKKEMLEILRNKALTAKEIAEALGIDLKTAYYHLNELKKAGIIRVDKGTYRVCLDDK